MKKLKLIVLFFVIFQVNCSINVYGISENFEYVINTIGIPRFNVYGQELNEDVYYTYNIFAYSSPKEASSNAMQGFKQVQGGKWTENNTRYIGYGDSGEYYYLGREYNGALISNVYYPVSFFPDTTPEYWNYMYVNDASNSWNDSSKYKYSEQIEHMKKSKILYDTLNFELRITNPYNLLEYNITPETIGFDKIMLDTCSTWKTNGIMNVIRKDFNGGIRYSIFASPPMAASATVKSKLQVEDVYKILENEEEKQIVINYGAEAINLTNYANIKHIKEIKAELYINGEKVNAVMKSKEGNINKSYVYTLSRENANSYPLYIEVKSSLYTEFAVDGLMQDGLSKTVNINIEKYKSTLEDAEIKELIKDGGELYVSSLIKTPNTQLTNSSGIIQCLRHICLKILTDYSDQDLTIFFNGEKINYSVISKKDGVIYVEINVPNKYITIASWGYLRNKYGDYFKIKYEDIGQRITNPNELTINIKGEEKMIKFDTIDNFNINLNYKLNGVINKEECYEKIKIENW